MPNNDKLNTTTAPEENSVVGAENTKETTTTNSSSKSTSTMIKGRDLLIYFSVRYEGDWDEIYNAIKTRIKPDHDEVLETIKKVESSGVKTLTILDENYPKRFNFMTCPPFVLFYKGDVSLFNSDGLLSIEVGSLSTEEERAVIKETSEKLTLVSDEAIAAKGDLGVKVVVSNKGILKTSANASLVLSEAFDTSSKGVAIASSRIIANFSSALLVAGVPNGTKALQTVSHTLNQGHPILCFPDQLGKNSLGNSLIKDGAILVETAEEIVDEYKYFK